MYTKELCKLLNAIQMLEIKALKLANTIYVLWGIPLLEMADKILLTIPPAENWKNTGKIPTFVWKHQRPNKAVKN